MTINKNRAIRLGGRGQKTSAMSHAAMAERILLQPWFLPRRIAFAIHALVPFDFWRKMKNVFDDYCCLICGTEVDYHSNGMCGLCNSRTRKKILYSARRHAAPERKARLDIELFRQQKLAKKLLLRFAAERAISSKEKHVVVIPGNPVYEALGSRLEMSRKGF